MIPIARRQFLATSGAVAAPLAGIGSTAQAKLAPPAESSARHPAHAPLWHLLAVAPLSEKMPALNADYRAGVALGLAQHPQARVQLHWVDAPALPSAATRRIAAALEQHPDVHGILGWMPPELERRMAELAHARGLPLWVSDTGADLPPTPSQAAPHVATRRQTLNLCAHAAQLAHNVFLQQGRHVVLAMGWMESGYDFVNAFQQQFQALGGRVVAHHIASPTSQAPEFHGLRRMLHAHRPDTVVAFYAGAQAQRFSQWWQAHRQGSWRLAGFPWLTEAGAPANALIAWPWPASHSAARATHNPLTPTPPNGSAATWLGIAAGTGIGQSLNKAHADGERAVHLRQQWHAITAQQNMAPPPVSEPILHALSHPGAGSGWLNGYLQT